MTSSTQVRQFLVSKGVDKKSIGIIYNDKRKNGRRFKIYIWDKLTQQFTNQIGESLDQLGCFDISIYPNEIIFKVLDK